MDQSAMPAAETERWLPVVGYEGLYEVSDLGRVRRLRRSGPRLIALILNKNAIHRRAHLCRNGVKRKIAVHVLVVEAFIGPRPEGMHVCHGPGGSLDNRLVNLSYGTPSQNNGSDRWRDGTIPAGVRSSTAKLTDEIVRSIRVRAAAGESNAALAREFGTNTSAIQKLVQGANWKHVDGPLTMRGAPRGELQWAARLTEETVRELRVRYAGGSSPSELARTYGISVSSVFRAVNRETWKHVA